MNSTIRNQKKILDKAKLFFKQAKFSRKQVSRLDYFILALLAQLGDSSVIFFFLEKF